MNYVQTLKQSVDEDIENYLQRIEKIQNRVFCKQKEEIYKYIIPLKKKVEKKGWTAEVQTLNQIIAYVQKNAFLPDSYSNMIEDIEEKLRMERMQRLEDDLMDK